MNEWPLQDAKNRFGTTVDAAVTENPMNEKTLCAVIARGEGVASEFKRPMPSGLCREHGVAEPVIEVSDSWVTTTFKRPTDQLGTKLSFFATVCRKRRFSA